MAYGIFIYFYYNIIISTDQNLVRVHDCVETVSDGENGTLLELLPNGLLDDLISPAHAWALQVRARYETSSE